MPAHRILRLPDQRRAVQPAEHDRRGFADVLLAVLERLLQQGLVGRAQPGADGPDEFRAPVGRLLPQRLRCEEFAAEPGILGAQAPVAEEPPQAVAVVPGVPVERPAAERGAACVHAPLRVVGERGRRAFVHDAEDELVVPPPDVPAQQGGRLAWGHGHASVADEPQDGAQEAVLPGVGHERRQEAGQPVGNRLA